MYITKKDFQAYEDVRVSGITNMWAISIVQRLSRLSKEKILAIMHDYSALKEKYLG